jgi:hypothetical protein
VISISRNQDLLRQDPRIHAFRFQILTYQLGFQIIRRGIDLGPAADDRNVAVRFAKVVVVPASIAAFANGRSAHHTLAESTAICVVAALSRLPQFAAGRTGLGIT